MCVGFVLWQELTLPCIQVESFIPLWEWDLPKKKTKKKRGEKADKKGKGVTNGETPSASPSPRIEPVADSGDSRPSSRQARVEEVPDEDS